ncbi:3'5'-cyclic nucleotide phosphodiesterase domain-containing protein, partial [Cardiosporidium cionae]
MHAFAPTLSRDDHCASTWSIGGKKDTAEDIQSPSIDATSDALSMNPPLSPQSTVMAWQSATPLHPSSLPPASSLPSGKISKEKFSGNMRFSIPLQKKNARFPRSFSFLRPAHMDASTLHKGKKSLKPKQSGTLTSPLFRRSQMKLSSHTPSSSCESTVSHHLRSKWNSKKNWKSIVLNLRPYKDENLLKEASMSVFSDNSPRSHSALTPSSHSPLHFDAPFQAAPLWRLLAPFSLRFKRGKMESMFAEFVQAQISKNLWWSLFVLSFCVMAEYFLTAISTKEFKPFYQPAHFLYTLGALIIVIGGLMISLLSRHHFFEPYLEACVAIFGTVFAALMVFTSDHYRVASILGFDAATAWGRISFSDAPLLLGLNAILWAIAIFIPVRSVCLWPVCLSAVISYQFATFVCGGPDGLRPSLLNILLLILLSYLALIGRRALEAQLRLQFVEVHRTAYKIESLEQKVCPHTHKR